MEILRIFDVFSTLFRRQTINLLGEYLVSLGSENMKNKKQITGLDNLDRGILKALQGNARQTYKEIGNHLGVAHSTVYDRIKRMEKQGVIKKYITIVDLEKIGVKQITAIMTIFTDPKESENVAQKLSELEKVLEVSTSLSEELSIIAKVVAGDQEELHSFIAQEVAPLPGVSRVRTSIITRKYKESMLSFREG